MVLGSTPSMITTSCRSNTGAPRATTSSMRSLRAPALSRSSRCSAGSGSGGRSEVVRRMSAVDRSSPVCAGQRLVEADVDADPVETPDQPQRGAGEPAFVPDRHREQGARHVSPPCRRPASPPGGRCRGR